MIKIIYILWFQGFNQAPDIVKQCVQSWKYYNPDWTIVLLDDTNVRNYVTFDIFPDIEKCHLADIVRMLLLTNYGGLWTDATTFCHRPLNDWLPEYSCGGFFAFDKPYDYLMLSNWFLYSEKQNEIITKWCAKTLEYYKLNRKAHTYFIHHQLFEELYDTDKSFHDAWDKVPKYTATIPHTLQIKNFFETNAHEDIDSKRVPLYKLSYKCTFPPIDNNLNLYYLYSTIHMQN